jgi:ABC-type transport system involved in multi-copper enzyme maturation permease subunit
MMQSLVIARLTLREAARRKLVAVFLVLTVAMIGLSAWGFYHLAHTGSITSGEVQVAIPQALVLFMFMFSFVLALSASAIASPAVSAEVESGVLLTVATRPIKRSEILIGKWLGLATLVAGYAILVAVLEMLVVDAVSGFFPPNPVAVAAYLFAEGVILLTLVLAISTRLSTLATGVLGVALFGAAWLAGVVGSLGTSLDISTLTTVGNISRYLLPTDGLWHGAIYYLEPSSLIARHLEGDVGGAGNPFFSLSPPSWNYLVYAALWAVIIFGIAITSFQRREL